MNLTKLNVLMFAACFFSMSVAAAPLCNDPESDPDNDGWGWEYGRSCKAVYCSDPKSDNDGDGWGWENNESCLVVATDAGAGASKFPVCSSSVFDNDGDGWGYENGQSCKIAGGSCHVSVCPEDVDKTCPLDMDCGCEIVPGLGATKQAFRDVGANRSFLASAMMETEGMTADYIYGDDKINDAFNAGVTKQNWYMMRQCMDDWSDLTEDDYAWSDDMNHIRSFDVQVYHKCRDHFGEDWFAGHRNGESGFIEPDTPDINNFKAAYDWTYNWLNGHECNDVRFWVMVPAI